MTKWLALAALTLASGCASLRFEPTANWLSAGGRLCAGNREAPFSEFDRAAPRSCVVADAAAPSTAKPRAPQVTPLAYARAEKRG